MNHQQVFGPGDEGAWVNPLFVDVQYVDRGYCGEDPVIVVGIQTESGKQDVLGFSVEVFQDLVKQGNHVIDVIRSRWN